jgi:hypothetical protein
MDDDDESYITSTGCDAGCHLERLPRRSHQSTARSVFSKQTTIESTTATSLFYYCYYYYYWEVKSMSI